MKTTFALVLALVVRPATTAATQENPLGKAIQLIDDLSGKITTESKESAQLQAENEVFCKDFKKDTEFEIKTGTKTCADLQASIEDSTATAATLSTKIDELVANVASTEEQHKKATEARNAESATYASEVKEMQETIDMLERAIKVLSRSLDQGGAAMVQVQNAGSVVAAFQALVQASSLGSADAAKLSALIQSAQDAKDDDSELGAPAAQAYESKSGSIIDTLDEMLETTRGNLQDKHREETNAQNNYELLAQELTDQVKYNNKDMDEAKKGRSAAMEKQKSDEGDLAVSSKDLAADKATLTNHIKTCKKKKAVFEEKAKSAKEELAALAEAKAALTDKAGAAADTVYSAAASLLQKTSSRSAAHDVLKVLRTLARKHASTTALSQLSTRVAVILRASDGSGDVFAKVKGLITDMIEKLKQQAAEEATKKAYCDKGLKENGEKKADLDDTIEDLSTKIDAATAKSASLSEEVKTLRKELAKLAKDQQEMNRIREEESKVYKQAHTDLTNGVEGVKIALGVLRNFYGDDAASSGSSIIGMMEVCESDFRRDLAERKANEEDAAADYEKDTKDNQITKATKEQDVKYKVKEIASLEKSVSELTEDKADTAETLAAVEKVLQKLDEQCTAKAETYEERAAAREAEIEGLKSALEILEAQASLLQTRHSLRGVRRHA